MRIGIPKEILSSETRVAATPSTVTQLIKLGFEVAIQTGAGIKASFDDKAYEEAGALVLSDKEVWQSDLVYKVNPPTLEEIKQMKAGATLVSFVQPSLNPDIVKQAATQNITLLAMDMVPRISRAQSLDALSSMANISGYRAVVEAAHEFGRFFTGQITAAGKVPPAKVLIIGAGVAGLAAIGTASSLGAIVRAFDTRPEVAEQIESMGGQFLKLDFKEDGSSSDGYAKTMSEEFIKAEMALFAQQAKEVDIIITTAMIPGKPAPRLITKEMVASMKPGSVIVDMAAATGGNCELTQAGQLTVTDNGVKIIGYTDLAGRLAAQSSQLYASNLVNLTKLICKEKNGEVTLDQEDVIIRNMTVVLAGQITFPPPPISVSATAPTQTAKKQMVTKQAEAPAAKWPWVLLAVIVMLCIAQYAPLAFLSHLMVFVLSCVVGYYVVWNVSHSLHTPLMSVTNAISGIVIIGALLQVAQGHAFASILAFVSVLVVSINIFGGFTVTQRMLKMFRKEGK
ncbi:Re/Si-specific NAD(P)(+) transhydrogenase subunit alpha [Basilea psittacipulmonis]|uniref:NAD(P) transhydrogenase subunit alpha n=1 Tax=Basilea psittacipulmonis DSM 24701 TaxID=1072685 RepID=A0A077DFK6_9BURK|nr:Re/Si-specific NAD(P)(+) transhydrogenase subunit alpha [Basilea psittacipulmonis]AIL31948.1 NAD(P) transhydrogenase subunit alpha [Basilea psittacipulmonis DSM 24701]